MSTGRKCSFPQYDLRGALCNPPFSIFKMAMKGKIQRGQTRNGQVSGDGRQNWISVGCISLGHCLFSKEGLWGCCAECHPSPRSTITHHTCWVSAQAHAGEEQVSLSNGGVCPWGALGDFQKQQHMTCRGQKAKSQSSKGPGYQWNLFVVREVWWYLSYSKIYRNPGCPFNKVLLSTYSAPSTALGVMKTTREM